jgi:hypothetical protein
MKKQTLIILLALMGGSSFAQTETVKNPLKISGYLETYYTYDFGLPIDNTRPTFVYSFNRHNEVNINLGFIKAAYETENVRSNLAFMTGTYANSNLANEVGVLKNIFEANVGVKISKSLNLWVDAGVFASHIGFESAIGKDCWNLTRSILADNSPYYESGAKISYTSNNEKWFLSGLLLNGWQRINRIDGQTMPAFGHQIIYKPSSKIILNSSSFVGNTLADSLKQMRYFHNFYGQFMLNNKFSILVGFDIGLQQKAKESNDYNSWYSPVLIVKYTPNQKTSIAARGEYYSDANGVIIPTNTPNGFQTFGYSLNLDKNIASNVVWRMEGRSFLSKDFIFTNNKKASDANYFLTTALAINF